MPLQIFITKNYLAPNVPSLRNTGLEHRLFNLSCKVKPRSFPKPCLGHSPEPMTSESWRTESKTSAFLKAPSDSRVEDLSFESSCFSALPMSDSGVWEMHQGMTKGLQVILSPDAHAATGLHTLPATSVTLIRVPPPPTHLQKNVFRVLFLLRGILFPAPPTHHSCT